ncbi:MAG: hypothetical protein AB1552_11465 [Nitrospirota bacterium]
MEFMVKGKRIFEKACMVSGLIARGAIGLGAAALLALSVRKKKKRKT